MNRNNAIISFYGVLLWACLFTLSACKEKKDDPDPTVGPFGNWTRTYTGAETYPAQLNLKESGSFEWIMLDTLSTHTNSYAKIQVNGDQVRIYDDPDFAGDGIYKWSVSGDILTLTMVSDDYTARISALTGNWNLKNRESLGKIIGAWQKTVMEQGNSYRVRLTMTSDQMLKWEMIDPIPGHTNSTVSFTATDNTIVIFNDPDCNGNGYFTYVVNNNELTCTYLKDKCPPRSQSFSGTWSKMK